MKNLMHIKENKKRIHSATINLQLWIFFAITLGTTGLTKGQEVNLNQGWEFVKGYEHNMQKNPNWKKVSLPHTWNATDVLNGNIAYYRGLGIYKRKLDLTLFPGDKRFFLRFDASATVTDVFVNGQHVGIHKGAFTGFTFDITKYLKLEADNEIMVMVNNAYNSEVMPLAGDFNLYGGIHRPVHLLVKNPVHFDLSNYGSNGIFISQVDVNSDEARLQIKGSVTNDSGNTKTLTVESTLWKANGKQLVAKKTKVFNALNGDTDWNQKMSVQNPHLWNGRKDPYRYQFKTFVKDGDKILDSLVQPIGLRYFSIDPDKGFFLNGEYYDLKGVCYHEAKKNKGSAVTRKDYEEDFRIITDMGVTAIRTAHYPHSPIFYEMCDSLGIVVYTEIPQVGPGGNEGLGFINSTGFKQNGKEQLKELIRQNYNHPSIIFWGLYNELKIREDDPHNYITQLNELAKKEDPYRFTMAASNQDNHNNYVTDVIGFNKYYGWYGSNSGQFGPWADDWHKKHPQRPMAISEYGAGASIHHQSDSLVAPRPRGVWHPEQWQTKYHEDYWRQMKERPYIWGKFAWLMFDVASSHRAEGDTKGLNDKGLVTEDRKTKKDAYYFYKANWNPAPMLYIAERRFTDRLESTTHIKVFTNLKKVRFKVNGKVVGSGKPVNGTVRSPKITLSKGDNTIVVTGKAKTGKIKDSVIWKYQ